MTVSRTLAEALRDATIDDVRYRHETIGTHSMQTAVKVGYAPVSVKGVAVPVRVPVTYVHATDVDGEYWYVVVPARNHESTIVSSEAEARALVLENLRALVGDVGGFDSRDSIDGRARRRKDG